tara:strand:- start:1295 stop:2053 length:759 start_codon:yes stop_codon:yes gene_type:complete
MKNFFLTLTLAFAFVGAQAQCTPDPQFTITGIYPDSATGLTNAMVGQAYNEVITIISLLDTSTVILGQTISVTIQTIELTSVTGLPPSFSYDCATTNCIFSGGSTSCAVLTSAGPTSAEIGSHQVIMNTTTTVDAGLFGIQTQNDVVDYYYINVSNATSVINQFNDFTFELKDVFPNPVNSNAKIQFISGNSADIVFTVFNYLGEKIEERNIAATRGVNDIEISSKDYANGMYLYSINNGIQVVSKRMIIEN